MIQTAGELTRQVVQVDLLLDGAGILVPQHRASATEQHRRQSGPSLSTSRLPVSGTEPQCTRRATGTDLLCAIVAFDELQVVWLAKITPLEYVVADQFLADLCRPNELRFSQPPSN